MRKKARSQGTKCATKERITPRRFHPSILRSSPKQKTPTVPTQTKRGTQGFGLAGAMSAPKELTFHNMLCPSHIVVCRTSSVA
ncbi:MAG: hypothetical protein IKB96_07735 [Prevotella sp.]|nr:hypothetical protein [Prevotella sp.]